MYASVSWAQAYLFFQLIMGNNLSNVIIPQAKRQNFRKLTAAAGENFECAEFESPGPLAV